jgi:nicotinamidase-related amidase
MPLDLCALVDPSHTAVVAMECQIGVLGENVPFPALKNAAAEVGMVPNLAGLMAAARAARARVFHCTYAPRPDGAGQARNTRLAAAGSRSRESRPWDPRGAEPLPELGPEPEDFVVPRMHGITPFHDTGVDALLRNLGVRTVIATGVSVNVGLTGLVYEAAVRGYQVVLPRDCIAGTPPEYTDIIIANTLSLLATVTTSAEIRACWARGS